LQFVQQRCGFLLRREPFYHKLRYAKVPKYDLAAALLGIIVTTFAGYMALATFGSFGTDLADLTTLVWYCLVGLLSVRVVLWFLHAPAEDAGVLGGLPLVSFVLELGAALGVHMSL
jgi:hypothetical protein